MTDQAASANNRKHAGLAYAVYDTAGDATTAATKTYTINGRAVQIKPLDADHDETGRRTAAAKEKKGSADAQAVDQYIVEKGLDGVLDAGVKNALRARATAWPAASVGTWPRPLVETRSSRTPMLTRSAF